MDLSLPTTNFTFKPRGETRKLDYQQNQIHADLVKQAQTGNSNAQFELYNLYADAMLNVAIRMMNNREDAEDILQDSFVNAFKKLNTFEFKSTFGAWLKRIVINGCLNQLRKKQPQFVELEDYKIGIPDEESGWQEEMLQVDKIKKGIRMLPTGYRTVLSMYLLEGYDHNEIAEVMNISPSTSKTQYSRAKQKLRTLISEF